MGGEDLWFEGFGTPLVGRYQWSDVGEGPLFASRSLDCGALDSTCSTCGRGAPCSDVPGGLPEAPTPPAVDGCACETDGDGTARVSLECFCSVYDCPTLEGAIDTCLDAEHAGPRPVRASSGCGSVELATGRYSGQSFRFDVASGQLIGAEAFAQGPIAGPCGTYRVIAGGATACEGAQSCNCGAIEDSCNTAPWLDIDGAG